MSDQDRISLRQGRISLREITCASSQFAERNATLPKRGSARRGFSLIELITAMLASTVLLASLAATVVISTNLLEVPPNDQAVWHDRFIADRLASDLRYATSVDESYSYGFHITKPDTGGGSSETVMYESYTEGLTRQVDSGPVTNLDADPPTQLFSVDGYSAPTYTPSGIYARVRSSSRATTSAAAASVDIDVPAGCKTGDLVLLAVSAKTPSSLNVTHTGWQTLSTISVADLRMIAIHQLYDGSWPQTITVSATPDSAMAVAMLAIQDVYQSAPIDWSGVSGDFALSFVPSSHPTPLETSGFNERKLNVQMFASDLDPWTDGALGMTGFTDVVQATAAQSDVSIRNTIGIAVRNGRTPASSSASLLHQASSFWLQTAVRVEANP